MGAKDSIKSAAGKPRESTAAPKRCYTIAQVCDALQITRRTFSALRRAGKLCFLEELKPRIGHPRFRADLLDKYLAGQWGQSRFFASARGRK